MTVRSSLQEHQSDFPKDLSAINPDVLQDIRTALSKISISMRTISAEDKVLQALWFPELQSRERSIDEAHIGTFRWLLHDPEGDSQRGVDSVSKYSSDTYDESNDSCEGQCKRNSICGTSESDNESRQEDIDRQEKREAFIKWLQVGNGVFYISGKVGSGKSTLMKSLAQDPLTRELLRTWANENERDLLFVQFFFWNSGSSLQKSIAGLYRGILWEILRMHPDLIQDVLPSLWRDAHAFVEPDDGQFLRPEIDFRILETAFDNLISNQDLINKRRICFFIDGLDEFDGDFWKLSKRLQSWCSSSDVKICVSSRPHNQFLSLFTSNASCWLKLHELTWSDMTRVVRDEFEYDERFIEVRHKNKEYNDLITSIVYKADGVFLWVHLAMRSLLTGIENSCSPTQLQKKLDALPDELNSMFYQMLHKIERSERLRVMQTLLSMKNDPIDLRPSTWIYTQAVLDNLMDNPEYEGTLLEGYLGPFMNEEEIASTCGIVGRRMIGRCQGLLEIKYTGFSFPYCHRLQFVHRTVSEFLGEPKIMREMQSVCGCFSPHRALALSLLATFKHVPRRLDKPIYCQPFGTSHRRQANQGSLYLGKWDLYRFQSELLVEPMVVLDSVAVKTGRLPFSPGFDSLIRMFMEYASFYDQFIISIPLLQLSGWYWEVIARTNVNLRFFVLRHCVEPLSS